MEIEIEIPDAVAFGSRDIVLSGLTQNHRCSLFPPFSW
jgi:hypothetical protein